MNIRHYEAIKPIKNDAFMPIYIARVVLRLPTQPWKLITYIFLLKNVIKKLNLGPKITVGMTYKAAHLVLYIKDDDDVVEFISHVMNVNELVKLCYW